MAFIERAQEALSEPFDGRGREVFLDASVGVALNTFGVDDGGTLLANAEAAMYRAKRRGGSSVEVFGESMRIEMLDRMTTEHSLHRALERRELMLHYQPVVEIERGDHGGGRGPDPLAASRPGVGGPEPVHAGGGGERADHPHRGVGPRAGLPPAADLEPRRGTGPQGSVEVNLSARQIDDRRIVRTVEEILARTGLPPEHLTLEITESALMEDAAAALGVLRALKEIGVLAGHRRLRHGVLVAELPPAIPARLPQGRSVLRGGARGAMPRGRRSSLPSSTWPTPSA